MTMSDDVGKGVSHPAKVVKAADQNDHGREYRDEDDANGKLLTDDAAAESLDDTDHRIQRIEMAPALRDDAQRVNDRRHEHPGLDEKTDRVPDVAVLDVQRRKP